MRTRVQYAVSDPDDFAKKLLEWSRQFRELIWLDSNKHRDPYGNFDCLLAVDAASKISLNYSGAFEALADYYNRVDDWIFGYLAYDLKNDLEPLTSMNEDGLFFPDLQFFQPKKIIRLKNGLAEFIYLSEFHSEIDSDFRSILTCSFHNKQIFQSSGKIGKKLLKDQYLQKVNRLLQHIRRGDIYEVNFCQEFFVDNAIIDPWFTFSRLNDISRPPFASFLKFDEHYALCASPERFLLKQGKFVVSQPIKGTAQRASDQEMDRALKISLSTDAKEKAENTMIVDLVRNDLSKNAIRGSVRVEELCSVYSFKQVHQMISTVSSRVPYSIHPVEILKDCFPMGSMTGAPKISAMKLIEQYEETKRGVYSGAIGYIDPQGNFDFNVVIRSILYNGKRKYLSFSVGSAITALANPEQEYQECLLKAKAMRQVIEQFQHQPIGST